MEVTTQLWEKTVAFHGHACPGLAIGYRLAIAGATYLGIASRSYDEEIVCIAETDACGVDAVQVLLGCSLGKGNLLLRVQGKNAMTFFHRSAGRACRVVWEGPEIPQGTGREEKMRLFLTAPSEECYSLHEVSLPHIPEALISPSIRCALCGELTAEHMMRLVRGQKLCLACTPDFSRILR